MSLYLYHATATADHGATADIGVCAESREEARGLIRARMVRDGYERPTVASIYRVPGPHSWEHGSVLIYSGTDPR